jgi:hypothetical protein
MAAERRTEKKSEQPREHALRWTSLLAKEGIRGTSKLQDQKREAFGERKKRIKC